MLKRLRLEGFKNFEQAELHLGPLTVLVGANASGKSNIRDAFRFLHGIGRGYSLAEIFGEAFRAGAREWSGVRGGIREAAYLGGEQFSIDVEFDIPDPGDQHHSAKLEMRYRIDVAPRRDGNGPNVLRETLELDGLPLFSFVDGIAQERSGGSRPIIRFQMTDAESGTPKVQPYAIPASQPALPKVGFAPRAVYSPEPPDERLLRGIHATGWAAETFASMRFLDFAPDLMRGAVVPGHTTLSERGENLSSVLHGICADPQAKERLIGWLRLLTPMDVVDFDFPSDQAGRVLLRLIERDGHAVSAYGASDGTLRFLGFLAALLSPDPPHVVFFEEIENGLHPTRLRLLTEILENTAAAGKTQIIATTHSPYVLALLHEESLKNASLVYRLEGARAGGIQRFWDIPDAPRVLTTHDRSDLLASGWFEDMVEFAASPREPLSTPDPDSKP